ncbi:MAG: glucose-1-phosphate cytidylyltransferase [Prochlorococcus marinus XMU1422]|nr:glucose-1-phosphate cytidylyltransferase [Prochlorococcus marinus XMU1421]MBO7013265.1 glucose-1-phosphate cytidylyltransferase [Prochlorococcus marinus XMU1422]MCR8542280.1 glucose-1-phosphate cytidylyltransferase [Prochlorococcus marinus XMU1423]
MKAVILAGGYGTRISEETNLKPKPMVEIGGKPLLWHIMKIYSHYKINHFIICCGYKGYVIKEYFANYFLHNSDVTIDILTNKVEIHKQNKDPWKITLIDTGENTMTGGRIKRIQNYIQEDTFCVTYGDGLARINIQELINFHSKSGRLATLTAVKPPGRFGAIQLSHENLISSFFEKPQGDGGWVNGGFFVLNKRIFDYIKDDNTTWEEEPLKNLALDKELSAFKLRDFWQPMDTKRDLNFLQDLWNKGSAPWKVWQ